MPLLQPWGVTFPPGDPLSGLVSPESQAIFTGDEHRLLPNSPHPEPGLPNALGARENVPFSVSSFVRKLETRLKFTVFFISLSAVLGVVLVDSDRPISPMDCLRFAKELALLRTFPAFLTGSG